MNKNDLVTAVADRFGRKKADVANILDGVFDVISDTLKKGDEVRLIGFGTFYINRREAGTVRNPRTGDSVKVMAQNQPKFRAGKGLKEAVN